MKKIDVLVILVFSIIVLPIMLTMMPTGQVHFMAVSGGSMEPTITKDDIILALPVNTEKLGIGDIISYKHLQGEQQIIITHRIVGITYEGIKTKGDAYDVPDSYMVVPEDVIGVMKLKIPYVGFLVHFARTTQGLMALVVLPAVLLIVQEMKGLIKGA